MQQHSLYRIFTLIIQALSFTKVKPIFKLWKNSHDEYLQNQCLYTDKSSHRRKPTRTIAHFKITSFTFLNKFCDLCGLLSVSIFRGVTFCLFGFLLCEIWPVWAGQCPGFGNGGRFFKTKNCVFFCGFFF